MLGVPHLDPVLPLVPGELVLVHDSGSQRKRAQSRHPRGLGAACDRPLSTLTQTLTVLSNKTIYFLRCSISIYDN